MIPVISFEHHTSCMIPSNMSINILKSMNFFKFYKSIYFNNMILRLL